MFLKAICPNCRSRGVKEYTAINHARPRVPGKGPVAEVKRSCPDCHHGWFPQWEKENTAKNAARPAKRIRKLELVAC
jgi:5-methylcytosine-specific restriction endonuclease McrA